jgi:hypothetical protein
MPFFQMFAADLAWRNKFLMDMPSKSKTVTNLAFMRHGENGFFDWKDYCSVSGLQG